MSDGFCHLKPDRLFDGVQSSGPGPLHNNCSLKGPAHSPTAQSLTGSQHTDEVCHLTDPMESETSFEADSNVRQLTHDCVETSEYAGCRLKKKKRSVHFIVHIFR